MRFFEMLPVGDVASIIVNEKTEQVINMLKEHFTQNGYADFSANGKIHFQRDADKNSILSGLHYRAMAILAERDDYTVIIDERNEVDLDLVEKLSIAKEIIVCTGYFNAGEYYYCVYSIR